jgi:NADH:ubiquinone oxidoreductase subunit 5 (subunit L)/multisubunit Na+/H+ antiporter MnhA subunit
MKVKSLLLIVPVALLALPELAAAQSFSLDTILPDALADKDFLEKMVTVIAMVIIAGTFVTLGFGVMGGIGDVFTTLSDARRMGEWSLFMKNLGMVIAVVIVGVVLAVLIYTWLTTISINPQVTIGG